LEQQVKDLVKSLSGFGAQQMESVGVLGFIFVMLVSLACGIFASHLYSHFYSGRSTGSQIHRAFPLLAISVTAIFVTIQFSLPLSLGLLGALSIVRFRTPIKEPEEIGFLMLVIAASISCATFNFAFLGIVLGVAVAGLMLLRMGVLGNTHEEGLIVVKLPRDRYQAIFPELITQLGGRTKRGRIDSISQTADFSVIAYSFRGLGRTTIQDLQQGLDGLVGSSGYDIFLNQQHIA